MVETTLANTIGALEIGTLIATFLFGVVAFQTYQYFSNFPEDRLLFKGLVTAIIILELVHTGSAAYEVYRLTIIFYGRESSEEHRYFGLASMTFLGGMITMLCQLFFCARVWKVLPKPWNYIAGVCMVAALGRGAGSLVLGSKAVAAKSMLEYRSKWRWLITTLLTTGATIDVVIAASMLYFLLSKRRTGLTSVGKLIDRLVAYTIRTGLFTSIGAVTMIIMFQAMPDTLVWIAIHATLAKLYSNSLLSALNERQSLRSAIASASVSGEGVTRPRSRMQAQSRAITIEMRTTTEIDIEDDAASHTHPRGIAKTPALAQLSPTKGPHSFGRERDYGYPDSPGGSFYPSSPSSVRFEYPNRY